MFEQATISHGRGVARFNSCSSDALNRAHNFSTFLAQTALNNASTTLLVFCGPVPLDAAMGRVRHDGRKALALLAFHSSTRFPEQSGTLNKAAAPRVLHAEAGALAAPGGRHAQ